MNVMTKKEYLEKLNDAFSDFKFYEEDHHYEYKGKRVGISVTTFYEQYVNEFDSQGMAEKVAQKNQKIINDIFNNPLSTIEEIEYAGNLPTTVEAILAEWKYKADFACTKGSTCHEYVQSLWSGEKWKPLLFDESEEYIKAVNQILKQANNFCEDYQDKLEHLADEFVIGSEEYDIASAIDHIFINELTGGLVLVDYKTNIDIYKSDRYAKKMKVPLSHLKDTVLNHYAIQLSIYKYIVEKYTDLKFEEMFIVWFSEKNDNYKIVEVPYLKDEVETILEWRKWE